MPNIIDYSVVVGEDKAELIVMVASWIRLGWQPQGGISAYTENTMCGPRSRFAQAVVKYEAPPIPTM
jgi:hypothetical protein